MFQRSQYQLLKSRLLEPRRFINVLVGPRQVGKTTLVGQVLKAIDLPSLYTSADAHGLNGRQWLESQWELARIRYSQGNRPIVLVIDEVQKIAEWSEIVKKLWDEDSRSGKDIRVVLLGSSRLLIQNGLTESLMGRFESFYMGHWTFLEMREAFDWHVDQFVYFGGYPGAATMISDESRWKDYVRNALIEPSILKDVLLLSRVDKPILLKRLFELGCLYSGQILSYTKVMGQLADAGNTTTLAHYLQLLNTAGLLCGLEKFNKEVIRKRASSPRFQVHNNALMSVYLDGNLGEVKKDSLKWGRLIESAIGTHLLSYANTGKLELNYWREGNEEVDYVISKGAKSIAIEVKSGAGLLKNGMTVFRNKFQPIKTLLVGDNGLPWQDFLMLDPESLWEG